MAFQYLVKENKVYLPLSDRALSVVASDMTAFSCAHKNYFFNHVFSNFKEEAESSISAYTAKLYDQYLEILSDFDNAEKIADVLVKDIEKKKCAETKGRPHSDSVLFSLNKENYEYLTLSPECNEEQYYHRGNDEYAPAYVCAVIEEYARLPYCERSRVYCKDVFRNLEIAIDDIKNRLIRITMLSGKTFLVRPYRLEVDKQQNYYYLVGVAKQMYPTEASAFRNYCFRLERICKTTTISKTHALTKEEKRSLDSEIEKKGIQYITLPSNRIVVLLTNEGEKLFNQITHQRPTYIQKTGNEYTFDCTEFQAKVYFSRFGKDAKIISPKSLAQDIKDFYYNGFLQYSNDT